MCAMAHKHQCDYKDIESFFIDTTISQKVTLRCNKVASDINCQKIRFSLYSFLLRSLSYEFKYSDTISDSSAQIHPSERSRATYCVISKPLKLYA